MIENYTRLSSRMFTATVVGKDKNGRKITEGRETYKTPSGVYEIKDWARLVEKATEAIDTQMIMGINMRTGQIEIAEYDGQIRGQMSFNDLQTQEPEAEPAQATTPAANATQPAAGTTEQQPTPTGKPLDLKNRNKKPAEIPTDQEQEKAEAAAGELVPGRDFDPETGEVFENGRPPVDQPTTTEQPKSNQHKVITMGPKAVNA